MTGRAWRPTPLDFERLTTAVERAEARTSAEIVIVFRDRSGTYRDAAYLVGAGAALLGLVAIIFNPLTVHDERLLPLELAALFAGGTLVATLWPWLTRPLTTAARRAGQVRTAAAARFVEEGVHRTRARTGLLIYLSALERRIELLPDAGITAAVPPDAWQAITQDFAVVAVAPDTVAALVDCVDRLADRLAKALPADAADNPDEISNRPRGR